MRLAALVSAVGLVASGCGGASAGAGEILSRTAANLGKIRSGDFDFELLVEPRSEKADGREFGFELHGPFALPRSAGGLPVADVEYVQIANGQRASARLISTGREAFVENRGTVKKLSAAQLEQLKGAGGELSSSGGLEQLRVGDWITDPKASDGGDVGGASTDKVEGDLDVVAAANDLIAVARAFGGVRLPTLTGGAAEQLREGIKSSDFELWTGKKDRLLRKLHLEAELGLDVPEDLRRTLGDIVGAKVTFELAVSDPNKPVRVSAPSGR